MPHPELAPQGGSARAIARGDVLNACRRLEALQQRNRAAVHGLHLMAGQQARAGTGGQVASEQGGVCELFLSGIKLKYDHSTAHIRKSHDLLDSGRAVDQQSVLLQAALRAFGVHRSPLDVDPIARCRELTAPDSCGPFNASPPFFSDMEELIRFMREQYLAVYEHLVEKYADFYKEFNEEIMAKMHEWIRAQPDGKHIELDREFLHAIQAFMNKWGQPAYGALFPLPGEGYATEAEARKWAKAMGSPNVKEFPSGSGQWVVMIDMGPLGAMRRQLEDIFNSKPDQKVNIDTAKFQAWQTGFNNQEGELKNKLQLYTTKYGNAQSYYDSMIKILSNQMSQEAETRKAYVSGI